MQSRFWLVGMKTALISVLLGQIISFTSRGGFRVQFSMEMNLDVGSSF